MTTITEIYSRKIDIHSESSIKKEFFLALWEVPPTPEKRKYLQKILSSDAFFSQQEGILLLPRMGIISPWSSKVTDIVKRCGLNNVRRVEKGQWFENTDELYNTVDFDPMTEQIINLISDSNWLQRFTRPLDKSDEIIDLSTNALSILKNINNRQGLGLSTEEIKYLANIYQNHNPTLCELMMFAQSNSEHCRHKIFNSSWQKGDDETLMDKIRQTHRANPNGVITAYKDNAAIIESTAGYDFYPNDQKVWETSNNRLFLIAKSETHNHPTAISPFSGAATGSGGEIRDEVAAGRGATTMGGFSSYIVSNYHFNSKPFFKNHNDSFPKPAHYIASPLQIMSQAPLGSAAYNNEFGRASVAGFFRCYSQKIEQRYFGFHKPLMLAGGVGQQLSIAAKKYNIPIDCPIIQLGGPGFCIGLGGGAASSYSDGKNSEIDFNSVQRANPEMQRRAQAVIDYFRRRNYTILSLHDVGAGGLANAVSELVHDAGRGVCVDLEAIPLGEIGMSESEIWCNESQERYVLALNPENLEEFEIICRRERCPYAVIGYATEEQSIQLLRKDKKVVDFSLNDLFTHIPLPQRQLITLASHKIDESGIYLKNCSLQEACHAILSHPTVASKRFLITIGDRSVGGKTVRDQMVGPWQTPTADCAVLANDFNTDAGIAFALGERAPIAALSPEAGVRMAIAEAILNLSAAPICKNKIKLSVNWMANAGLANNEAELHAAVSAASDFCIKTNTSIIVGKDSLSMRVNCDNHQIVESPTMAATMAFTAIDNLSRTLTPQLSTNTNTVLMYLSFSSTERLGGSIASLLEIFNIQSTIPPDIEATALVSGQEFLESCKNEHLLLSYHDCSDGGLWAALVEMSLSGNIGLDVFIDALYPASETDGDHGNAWEHKTAVGLFHEEIAVLFEVQENNIQRVMDIFAEKPHPTMSLRTIARPQKASRKICVYGGHRCLLQEPLKDLRQSWEDVSSTIAKERGDNPNCVDTERNRNYEMDSGLFARAPQPIAPTIMKTTRPRVAILREQGSNGHYEMAAAFTKAGFDSIDLTMTDLAQYSGVLHDEFSGLALCGGFSFGDVLGAGAGWAMNILHHQNLKKQFQDFFFNQNRFVLGICNGCQVLSQLQNLMPNENQWCFPQFLPNLSNRFEARLVMAEVMKSPSALLSDMEGAMFPIVVSHGEGRTFFPSDDLRQKSPGVLRYIDNEGQATETYPYNPNGSPAGVNGFCSPHGHIVAIMAHPDRTFSRNQLSYIPQEWSFMDTPWMQLFYNARRFIG